MGRSQSPIKPATDSHQSSAKHWPTHRREQLTTDTVYKSNSKPMMHANIHMAHHPRVRPITASEFIGGIPTRGQSSYTNRVRTVNSIGNSSTLSPVTTAGRSSPRVPPGRSAMEGHTRHPAAKGDSAAVRGHICSGQHRRRVATQPRDRPATVGGRLQPRRTTEIA